MDKSTAKFLLPAGLAVVLLVVLRAQNQSPAPSSKDPAPTPTAPAKPVVRPRSVVSPPPTGPAPVVAAPAETTPATSPATPATSGPPALGKPATTQPAPPVSDVPKVSTTVTTVVETPTPAAPAAAGTTSTPPTTPGASTPNSPGTPAATTSPRVPRPAVLPGSTAPAPPTVPLREGPVVLVPSTADPTAREIEFTESAMDVGEILDKYEAFTGHSTLRDGTIQGTQLPLRSNGLMTRKQAAEYIKAFLLLNGYSIVPSDIKDVDKVIPTARGPQLEQGAEIKSVYTDPKDLPASDQVINYILYLKNIGAEEAQRSLSQVITPSRQGGMSKITPVPAAGALIITDTIPAIRLAIALQEKIDVAIPQVVKKFFRLDRADAEEVAGVLTDILAAQTKLRSQASGGTRSVPVANAGQSLQNALPPGAVPNITVNNAGGGGNQASQPPDESTVIVKAITRTNEVLVSGRPGDIRYLEDLIHELDKEAKVKNLKRFQLRFIRVEDFLTIAQDAIGRGQETIQSTGAGGGAGPAGGANRPGGAGTGQRTQGQGGQGNQFNNAATTFGSNSTSRSSASGLGGAGGGTGGGLNRGRSSSSGGNQVELVPTSQVVGKTLLISEPRSNTLLVAGPPEHLIRIGEVLREMDVRPLQISISAVIAEVTLTDTMEHGIDILRKVESIVAGGQDITYAGTLTNIGANTGIIDPNTLSNVPAFANIGNGLNLYGQLGEYFNIYIKALEQTGRVQVISRPFIFTANNKEADISIGRRIPVPASSQSSVVTGNTTTFNTNIEYEDVNLELIVTPLINSKDEVTLTISQTNDDVLNFVQVGNQSAPQISQQTLDTEVAVPNGGIAVIGGLIRDKNNADHNGLPWITRIPIIRSLLGHTKKFRERGELLIFIQPRIVGTSEELEAMHTDHVRRTIIGKEAEKMAKPPYNTTDVVLPTENGDIPLDSASSLLPAAQSPPVDSGFEGSLKAAELDKENAPLNDPANAPAGSEPLPVEAPISHTQKARVAAPGVFPPIRDTTPPVEFDSTIPNEKPKPPFWEKPSEKIPEKSGAPGTNDPKSSGLKRLLPWNWGKKQKPDA